ncbi:MAG: Type 1 glutamine amidotransferase-like domain-containing protein [Chloroflexota bacterium]|nr:Type 1 glutamine amidotransferase-like domain-containing protein [Chloroflexota bacterium]
MAAPIALVGGDEFRRYCGEMDQEIMAATGKNSARVVVLPTAAVNGPVKAAHDGVTHFSALGGNGQPLMILDREQANDDEMVQRLAGADVIYFTGGNPNHLLETLQDSRLLDAIGKAREEGAILAGSSAGAMVMGSVMRRPRADEWVTGLGIAQGICVLPHHERSNPAEVAPLVEEHLSDSLVVFGIDAQTACLGLPGEWKVIGHGKATVYRQGGWQVYQPGETIKQAA